MNIILGVFLGIVYNVLYIYIIYNTLDRMLPYLLMKKVLGKRAPKIPGEFIFLTIFSLVLSIYYIILGAVLFNTLWVF